MVIIVAEKPSAARKFGKALGGSQGAYRGTRYRICALRGHLLEFAEPKEQVDASKARRYASWRAADLPWDPDDLSWEKVFRDASCKEVAERLARALQGADEACIATDDDPTGEGELLAWEALEWCGWDGRVTRMHFVDEEPGSVRAAFEGRVPIPSMAEDGDYRKAEARSRWDFLSMQLTRAATDVARSAGHDVLLRQGRLKSVMVSLVGDQQRAHDEYVRRPFYEARFRDAAGNVLARKEPERHDVADAVDLSGLGPSPVVVDGRERRRTAPRRLLDLASLSSLLAPRGHSADEVLKAYQRMYEDGIVSYPRTEDRTVTPEQFAELSPLTSRICAVVGVDEALLTHRDPRPTHVRAVGAHGANRPGPNVPSTLRELERYGAAGPDIYYALARSWLATLAEDHEWDLVRAHVRDHPDFVGEARVTASRGFLDVFDPEAADEGTANRQEWASPAKPYVHEGANRRPQRPTQRWLMRRLERHAVGTGATRTSVFAEACSGGTPLMEERKGVVALTEAGRLSWALTRGCEIASPEATERLLADMERIGRGELDPGEPIAAVAGLVERDLARMRANAASLPPAALRKGKGLKAPGPRGRRAKPGKGRR